MSSLSPTIPAAQITGPPWITCVDVHGFQVPSTELWSGPAADLDRSFPSDPADWPASSGCDDWLWQITEPDDTAEIEAVAIAELPPIAGGAPSILPCDVRDFNDWLDSLDSALPPRDQAEPEPSVDRMKAWYASWPSFHEWLESQGGPRP